MVDARITVILNAYKRTDYLSDQIEAVLAQTLPPERIMIWSNGAEIEEQTIEKFGSRVILAASNFNFGVWARFAYALNAETEYVCMLDDDTFPGRRFFESCLSQMEIEPALLGARGLRFLSRNRYHPFESFGWDSPSDEAHVVDIVGHAWFFRREWLGAFWSYLPSRGTSRMAGEDMHFSFMLQKHLGIRTIVPPHPADDQTLWGSNPDLARKLGMSKEAISQNEDALRKFDVALKDCTERGFRLYKDSPDGHRTGIVIGPGVSRLKFLKRMAVRYPALGQLGKRIRDRLAAKDIHI